MDDLELYIEKRKHKSVKFSQNYEKEYENFKIGEIIRITREEIGMTQDQLAKSIKTTKSVISRIENHAQDIKLSTLNKVVTALGKNLSISII